MSATPFGFYLPGDDEPFTIAIGQIVYNNVTQGIYLNRTTWESLRKGEFVPTGLMLKNPDETYLAQLGRTWTKWTVWIIPPS